MTSQPYLDQKNFQRILTRNVALPLAVGLLSALLFVGMILYLLSVIGWVEHTDRVLGKAHELQTLSVDQETGMRGFLITADEKFLDPYEVAIPKMKADIVGLIELVADNPPQVDRVKRIAALQDSWDMFAREIINQRRAGKPIAEIIGSGRGKRLTDEIRKEFEDLLDAEQRLRVERNDAANRNTVIVIGIYLFISLALGGMLAWVGRRELLGLSASYGMALDEQSENALRLEGQAWLRTGQSRLGDNMAGKQDMTGLGRSVLEFLAGYTDSVVGALYVREDSGLLRRVAAYGFTPEALAHEQAFDGGQTLVGEAAAGKRLIALDDVPDDYLRVTSGLGHGKTRSALVAPVDSEGSVNGVIELGFLRPLAPRDTELMALIAGTVGAAVEAARYRERLQNVLAETQQLNEELQVQQEELRTANEELEEQSRALKESQAHLETQQAELEQTNVQLAEQADALADQRDNLDQKNTALNRVQSELEKRAEELQRASRYKSEFLANMSHELRTPLNSSLILAKLLGDNPQGNLSEEQVKFADSIYSAGNDLLNLINDILDISKVEAGKLEVRPETTGIARLADGLRDLFQPLADKKKLAFEVRLAPGLPPTMVTDAQRVEQVVKNLLSNAVKFTAAGRVTLDIAPQDGGRIAFAVTDSGIGIEPAQQEVIFEAFRQADGTTSRRYGGTGLGLSISRDLAHLLGGTISVRSTPGEGSTFTLVLPLAYEGAPDGAPSPSSALSSAPAPAVAAKAPIEAPIAPAAAPAAPAASRGMSPGAPTTFQDDRNTPAQSRRCVLVIEDEPQFAKILYDLARELGYRCLVTHHAEEGVEMAAQYAPDAVLLDMRLPDGSGLTVLQRLKESPRTRHIPVHVISVEDRQEAALQLGAIGYAVKPASREQLKDVFGRIEAKLTQKLKRVLLVEDDELQRESVARLIGDSDVEIVAVEFGEKALELLRTTVFDVMVIDLTLPDMQGSELLQRMASEEIRSFPPVIVYTGRNLTRAEEADLMRYSRSIIIKGARSPERLLDEVTLFLHKVETELSSDRQRMLKTARSRDKVFEGRKILVVDDDVRNIFALTSALEHKGAVVEVGRNGLEALAKLEQVADIDLVLMDVMMPEMDGFTATREIRKNPRWQKLPIIAVTAKAMKDDQDRCLQAGANDYLAKPIELDRLFSLIRVWMPKLERI